jgi:hypothetical protein
MPELTIESHTETADGYRLVVRVPETTPEALAAIAGTACWAPPAEEGNAPTDTLHTTDWPADVGPEDQRREARLLLESALTPTAAAPAEPVAVTEPGTEL